MLVPGSAILFLLPAHVCSVEASNLKTIQYYKLCSRYVSEVYKYTKVVSAVWECLKLTTDCVNMLQLIPA